MPAWVDGKLFFYADSPPRRLIEVEHDGAARVVSLAGTARPYR